jgi:uncharacterized membrane protein
MVTVVKKVVRGLLALLFLVAGVLHFGALRKDFAAIVPPPLPKDETVLLSGVLEILGGIGLLVPSTCRLTAISLILFLIAVFPANVYGRLAGVRFRGQPHPPLSIRLPLQVLLIVLLWWSTRRETKRPDNSGAVRNF